jgi:hypothetical protein
VLQKQWNSGFFKSSSWIILQCDSHNIMWCSSCIRAAIIWKLGCRTRKRHSSMVFFFFWEGGGGGLSWKGNNIHKTKQNWPHKGYWYSIMAVQNYKNWFKGKFHQFKPSPWYPALATENPFRSIHFCIPLFIVSDQ